jgi:transcriptional regulator with XRE-family HTH domain
MTRKELLQIRKKLGLSLQEMANAMGVTYSAYTNWERDLENTGKKTNRSIRPQTAVHARLMLWAHEQGYIFNPEKQKQALKKQEAQEREQIAAKLDRGHDETFTDEEQQKIAQWLRED